jgi:hypothetical protein
MRKILCTTQGTCVIFSRVGYLLLFVVPVGQYLTYPWLYLLLPQTPAPSRPPTVYTKQVTQLQLSLLIYPPPYLYEDKAPTIAYLERVLPVGNAYFLSSSMQQEVCLHNFKITVLWSVMYCRLVDRYWCFPETSVAMYQAAWRHIT